VNNAPTTPILQTTNNNLEPVCNNTTGLKDPTQNTPFFCTEGQPTSGNRAWNSHQTATAAKPEFNSPNTADNMDIGSTSSSGETTYHYLIISDPKNGGVDILL
ncbi:MAG: hypothetical protein P8M34_11905, partial [Saprospiraceae bacterium]|nr:hypothetical protein [Saprospiraceae bacterium]